MMVESGLEKIFLKFLHAEAIFFLFILLRSYALNPDDYYGLLIAQHFITDLLLIIQKFTLKARFFNYLVTFVKINLTTKAPSQ